MEEAGAPEELVRRAVAGDRDALGAVLESHRERLLRMVRARLDRRLRGRVGASDVLQEAVLEVTERLPEYARDPRVPFFVWLRFVTAQRLLMVHRRHLGVKARDAGREVRIGGVPSTGASSADVAREIAASQTSPSDAAAKREMRTRLREVLDGMEPQDREVLSLRHFEHLDNSEIACELGLTPAAASKRYARAFRRLAGLMGGGAGP